MPAKHAGKKKGKPKKAADAKKVLKKPAAAAASKKPDAAAAKKPAAAAAKSAAKAKAPAAAPGEPAAKQQKKSPSKAAASSDAPASDGQIMFVPHARPLRDDDDIERLCETDLSKLPLAPSSEDIFLIRNEHRSKIPFELSFPHPGPMGCLLVVHFENGFTFHKRSIGPSCVTDVCQNGHGHPKHHMCSF